MKLVNPPHTTLADLLNLPSVHVNNQTVEVSKSLKEVCGWTKEAGRLLPKDENGDLTTMRFRAGQSKTIDGWDDLYWTQDRTTKR